MKTKDALIGLFTVALVTWMCFLWLAPAGLARVPDIQVTTTKGEQISLAELHGRPLLVNFWATTCSSCIKEMPHLVELYQELSARGFEMLGIAMAYDPPNRVIALSEAQNIPYPIALDINSNAANAFGNVRLTPSSFLIAPDGRVVYQKIGGLDMTKVRSLVLSMLAEQS